MSRLGFSAKPWPAASPNHSGAASGMVKNRQHLAKRCASDRRPFRYAVAIHHAMNSQGPSLLAKIFVATLSALAMAAVPLLTVNYVAQAQASTAAPAAQTSACCAEKAACEKKCDAEKKCCSAEKQAACAKEGCKKTDCKKADCPAGKK